MTTKKTTKTKYDQQTKNDPPSWTAPGLAQAAGMVQTGLGQIPTEHYSGQQVAFMSPAEEAGIRAAWDATAGNARDLSGWMQGRLPELSSMWDWQSQLPTEQYDVGQLYDVNPVIQAALNPVRRQLTEQILPGISSSALDAGAYSGDRAMKVLPQTALQDYSREASDIAAQIGYQNYRDYEGRRLDAWQSDMDRMLAGYAAETQRGLGQNASQGDMMSSIADYVTSILRNQASTGDLLNMSAGLGVDNAQAKIADALARDQYASYSPFMGLDQASALLAQLSGNWGTQDVQGQQKTVQKTGGLGEIVKGAIGLASMVAGIPGIGGAGGLLGGLGKTAGVVKPSIAASSIFGNG